MLREDGYCLFKNVGLVVQTVLNSGYCSRERCARMCVADSETRRQYELLLCLFQCVFESFVLPPGRSDDVNWISNGWGLLR